MKDAGFMRALFAVVDREKNAPPVGFVDESNGVFEWTNGRHPLDLTFSTSVDLNDPATRNPVSVPRAGDVLQELVYQNGSSRPLAVEMFQHDFFEKDVVFDRVPCSPGRHVVMNPFPRSGLHTMHMGKPVYVRFLLEDGMVDVTDFRSGRLLFAHVVLPSALRSKVYTWTTRDGERGVGCLHRDGTRVFRPTGITDFGSSPNAYVVEN